MHLLTQRSAGTTVLLLWAMLVAVPLAAILLIIGRPQARDPVSPALGTPGLRTAMGLAGALLYAALCISLGLASLTQSLVYLRGLSGCGETPGPAVLLKGEYR